jgi:uncharacterized protein YlzI (FlbEa/FlbD family)
MSFLLNEEKKQYEETMTLVKKNGTSLRLAPKDLRNNFDIVMEAVKKYGHALEYASEHLQNNPEIVIEAIKKDFLVLRYASSELKNDLKFMMKVIKIQWESFYLASEKLKKNPDIIIQTLKSMKFTKREEDIEMMTILIEYYKSINSKNLDEILKTAKKLMLQYLNHQKIVWESFSMNRYLQKSSSYQTSMNYFKCYINYTKSNIQFDFFEFDLIFYYSFENDKRKFHLE